jgi:hypothetical protein
MRLGTAAVVSAGALAIVGEASAIESTIYPGVGIGKVKLGMTQAQVKRALGSWRFVNEREGRHLSVGWGFGELTADFVNGRVVEVATTLSSQKTRARVGPGSTWRDLVRAYPNGVCTANYENGLAGRVEYLVPHAGGTQTIYWVKRRLYRVGETPPPYRVAEVHVRTRWVPVTFGAKAWSVSASVTNRSTKTIQVVRSVTIQAPRYHYPFSLLGPPECKPPAIMCQLVVFAATYFKLAKPSRLGPGQTWSGVFGGPKIPPRGRLISIGFGDFAVPGDTFSYVTQHGFKR